MEEAFGPYNEGFCWGGSWPSSGECRCKKTVGESCRNSAGHYDNNNCVTWHCNDNTGKCDVWKSDHDHCDGLLGWYGWTPETKGDMQLCDGDCDCDDDCSGNLECWRTEDHGLGAMPRGCQGAMYHETADYCVAAGYSASMTASNPLSDDMGPLDVDDNPRPFEIKVVFPGPMYAVAFVVALGLLCCAWTVMVRQCRHKPHFQAVSRCSESEEEDNCL